MVNSLPPPGSARPVWLAAGDDPALASRLRAVGIDPRPAPEGCALALVDLREPANAALLARLRAEPATRDLLLLALVPPADPAALERALEAGADGLVADDRLEAEAPARLRLLARRQQERDGALRHERDLAALLELTGDYAGSRDATELVHKATRRLAEELGLSRCALVIVTEDPSRGRILATSDAADADPEREVDLALYPELREVLRHNRPLVLPDAPRHPLLDPVKDHLAGKDIGAIAALPVAVDGRVLGALLLRAGAARRTFSPREIAFASTVAHATAIALRNARLLATAEARVADLARYQSFFESFTLGLAVAGPQGELLTLNPAGARMLGAGAESAGARAQDLFYALNPAGAEAVQEQLVGAAAGRRGAEVDVQVRLAHGEAATLAISAAPLTAKKGDPLFGSALVCFRDVTKARLLQAELRKTKEFLERLIDQAADAIIAADMSGTVILFNKGAERICGYSAEEALGKLSVRRIYHPDGLAKELMAKIRAEAHGGVGRLEPTRVEIVSKTGERVPVSMTASLITEEVGGKLREVGTVGIFSDLRERVNLERRLSATQAQLAQTEKTALVAELAGTAAHELNQPLTSIMGYAELLRRRLADADPNARAVDIIYREAERMAEIVRKIGKITKYETKPYVGDARIVDLDRASEEKDA